MESDTTPLSAPEVPAETVKTDDNATTLPPTPVDGSPSRDALRPSDTDSNDNAEAKVEELTATLPPEQPSPTIASAEPSDPLNNITVTTPSEPKAERAEPELSACSVPPVTSTPTSSPSLKPHEGDCTPPENKDERSAEGHSVAESVSSATTVAATTIGVTEDKRSPTVNGTAGTTPTSSPSRVEVINTSSEGKQLVVDPPPPPPPPPRKSATPASLKNEPAVSTQDQKVAAVLEINAELLKACVDFQAFNLISRPEFQDYTGRLQANLLWIAAQVESSPTSIPIPPLSAPSPVLPLFLQAHQSAPQLPPPQTTASGVMKLVMTYDHLRGIIEKEGPRLPLPPPLINGPVVNGVVPGAQPQPQPQPQSVVGGVMVMNGVNGLKRERDEELIEDGIRRRKRLDTGDRKISSSPSISQDPSGGINGATFSGHHGPASHHGGPVIATSSTPAMTADNSHSQQPPPHLTHSQPQPPFNPMTSQISTQGPGQVHVQMGAPMRPSPIHTTSQLNAPQQSSPLGAISPTAGPQQPSHPSQLPNIRTSMPFSQQSHHPQQPHGGMNPQGPQQIPSQDPASQQQAIQQMQFRRQQQALIYQQHQARAAAANAAAGGGGLPPQANGLLPGAPGAQPTQVGPPQSGAAVTGAGIPGAGGSVAPNANPTFRSPQNAFSPQQQQAFIHQAVQTLKASGIGNGPLGPTGAPTNTLGTTHAPQMVGPVVQHLLKSSPGFLQLPFETQVQQLATLQMHLALRNRQSQAHQHQQQAQAQQAATSLVAGATAAGAGGPRPPSAVGSASGTMASTPTSAPAPPSSSHGMSPPPPPRSASVVPNVPGVGGDPRASGSPQSAVAPSPRLSQPPTNHSSDQQQHGQAGAPGSQPPFGYSSSPTTMNSPASGPSGMRPSSSASNRNVSASHYSMPAQQLLPGQQGQQSLQQPGPQHGPQVPQTPQQQHQQHHHPSQQQQQQQPVQSQQPQQSQQDQPRQGLVQPPPGSGPAQALQNGVYPNITPQQKYQMGLLQHMRQGMGPGPAAIAGGTGMGPGGYAATQQGYAPIDKMRAVNHLPMMAGMSMGGATGSGHSGNTGIDPNSMMGGHQTGVARPPSVHPGAAAGARNSPALNPQQLLAQQQHNQYAQTQQSQQSPQPANGPGGFPNPFQLSLMQQHQQVQHHQQQQQRINSSQGSPSQPQFLQPQHSGGGWAGAAAGFGGPATSGGWNMGDVSNAGGDMAHASIIGGNPAQQEYVDPLVLYTNNWTQ